MRRNGCVDYVELPGGRLEDSRKFYAAAFDWRFVEYGPSYVAVENAGVDAGLQGDPAEASSAPLVLLWADDLETALTAVREAGGEITQAIFAFPGGRRFHFRDPAGNELGVWSDRAGAGETR